MELGQVFRNIGQNISQTFLDVRSHVSMKWAKRNLKQALKPHPVMDKIRNYFAGEIKQINYIDKQIIRSSHISELSQKRYEETVRQLDQLWYSSGKNHENIRLMSSHDMDKLVRAARCLPVGSTQRKEAEKMVKATIGPTIETINRTNVADKEDLKKLAAAAKLFPTAVKDAIEHPQQYVKDKNLDPDKVPIWQKLQKSLSLSQLQSPKEAVSSLVEQFGCSPEEIQQQLHAAEENANNI